MDGGFISLLSLVLIFLGDLVNRDVLSEPALVSL